MSTNVVLRLQFFFFLLASKSSFFTQRSKIRLVWYKLRGNTINKKRRRKRHKHTYLRNYVCIAKLNLYRRESCLGEKRDATVRFVFSCSEYVIRARANVNPFFFSSLLFLLCGPKTRRFVGKGEIEARRRVALSSSLLSESGKQLPLVVVVVRDDALARLFPSVLVSVPDHYYTPLVPIQNQQIKSLY